MRTERGLSAWITLAVSFACFCQQAALAQIPSPVPPPPESSAPEPAPTPALPPADTEGLLPFPEVLVHGFVSQGAFLSTDNDFLGHSTRGSFEFFEAAVNVSTEVADQLRIGAQLFTRDLGPIGNYTMTLDWAYLDYRWREWLGLRAGRVKMPFGLYNEFSDIDAARLPILLPQSVYPVANRDFLLAQTGFSLYGSLPLGAAGAFDYQLLGGTIFISESTILDLPPGISIREIDTKYVAGGQLFWRTPLAGLRTGASYLHTNIAVQLEIEPFTAAQLRMAGTLPPDFDGALEIGLRRINLAIASLEYSRDDWLLSAEYSRWLYRLYASVPEIYPGSGEDSERFYGMISYRFTQWLEMGGNYSVLFVDADDRDGRGPRFTARHRAYQKDLAVSARFDVNDFWLWKLEGHFIDGTANLSLVANPDPAARWGFFLVKTTLLF